MLQQLPVQRSTVQSICSGRCPLLSQTTFLQVTMISFCRALTNLAIRGCLEAMPVLPAQLQHLRVSGCRHLRSLPPLPGTLQTLHCSGCGELTALHKSLASTAVTELICSSCEFLWELPDLPVGLKDLCVENCTSLREVRQLLARHCKHTYSMSHAPLYEADKGLARSALRLNYK
jgi:hypothetical protein